jgi:hypothetical protein
VSITKVVVFSTTNPTKLSLNFSEFSTIFYAFYKFLQIGYTIEDVTLRLGPSKNLGPCNWVPRPTGRRARRKSGGSGGAPGRGNVSGRTTRSPRVDWWPWLGQRHDRRGYSAMASGGGRGGSGSGEGRALGWQLLTRRGATGPKEVAHAHGGLEVKRDGGLPAAATVARCGGLERRGWREGRRNTATLYRARARG